LSPIENALNSITTKNHELEELISSYEANNQQSINPFSMALNGDFFLLLFFFWGEGNPLTYFQSGMIDAAVNGGISKYQEVFFSPEYTIANPDNLEFVNSLKAALNEQIQLLTRGL